MYTCSSLEYLSCSWRNGKTPIVEVFNRDVCDSRGCGRAEKIKKVRKSSTNTIETFKVN